MKVLIIGGAGKTGRELIQQGLDQNHMISVLARRPNKIQLSHPNLTLLKGDVLIPESLEKAIEGQEAVLCALGHKRFIIKTTILSRGTKNIIEALEKHNIKRFICISSLGINDSRFKLGLYYTLFTIPLILYFYFHDKSKQEQLIFNSDLDWTIVRPGQLTNGKGRRQYKPSVKAGHYILTKMISRADVAHFMLEQLQSHEYVNKAVGLTN